MKLLITGSWRDYEKYKDKIKSFDVTFFQDESLILKNPEEFDAVICNNLFQYNCIENFKKLRFIQTTSVGLEKIPLEYTLKNNIVVKNIGNSYSVPISEYVISSILFYYKRIHFFEKNQKEKIWQKNRNIEELKGKSALIFGCGNIGKEIAKRLKPFGVKVSGIDTTVTKNKFFNYIYSPEKADSMVSNADIVISCLPSNKQTLGFFNSALFQKFKRDSVFVNISRGSVVVEKDLINALGTHIGYCILDVFENEPLPLKSPLWNRNDVFITPHNSFESNMNSRRVASTIIRNLKKLAEMDI